MFIKYFSIYWLRKEKGKMEAQIDFNEERPAEVLKKAEENLQNIVDKIREGRFLNNSKNCRMCYFERICHK